MIMTKTASFIPFCSIVFTLALLLQNPCLAQIVQPRRMANVQVTTKPEPRKVPRTHLLPNPNHVTRYEVWLGEPQRGDSQLLNWSEGPPFFPALSPNQGILLVQVPAGQTHTLYGRMQYFTNGRLVSEQRGYTRTLINVARGVHINADEIRVRAGRR